MAHLLFCCPTNILINSILIDTKINLKRTHKVVALLKSHTSTLFQTSSAFHKTKNWVGLEKNVTCESDITDTMFLFLHIATHFLHKSTHPRERCPIMATPMFLHKAWCISLDKLKPNILCVQGIPAPPPKKQHKYAPLTTHLRQLEWRLERSSSYHHYRWCARCYPQPVHPSFERPWPSYFNIKTFMTSLLSISRFRQTKNWKESSSYINPHYNILSF